MFCTLHIRSNDHGTLPAPLMAGASGVKFEFVDNQAPEQRARRARVRGKLGLGDVEIPRYHWQLRSEESVSADDIYAHVQSILAQLGVDRSLGEMLDSGYEFWFSVFWQGNGTGGGPLITQQMAALLMMHKVDLGIGFYLDS